jgi:lactate dehydrogenase-like 2-hydroxyacid dehydrogenase
MSDGPVVLVYDLPLGERFAPLFERYGKVAKMWEQKDPIAFAQGEGKSIRALFTIGAQPIDPKLIEAFPNLGIVSCIGAGYEGVPLEACRKRGITVTNSAGANAEDVADIGLSLLLAVQTNTIGNDAKVREGRWIKGVPPTQRRSMVGLRVGVVGLGAIGLACAKRLDAFGCKVSWWGPREKPGVAWPRVPDLMQLAKQSDVLMVAARADASNRGLISKEIIHTLGPQGVIINISRGAIIDEDAMIAALKSGALGGAGLDVFEIEPTPAEKWNDVPNTVLSPHTAGAGLYAVARYQEIFMANFDNFFAGKTVVPNLAA